MTERVKSGFTWRGWKRIYDGATSWHRQTKETVNR